jgi:UDP-3-O-[3-hydroxymyristoyl] glucosamine N-acyltransferase
MTLGAIAKLLNLEYDGPAIEIDGMNTLQEASSSQISFLSDKRYVKDLANTKAAAVIIDATYKEELPPQTKALESDEPYLKMALLSKEFAPALVDESAKEPVIGEDCYISPKAHIENGASIGRGCTILAGAYVGSHAKIADNVTLHPNVTVYAYCEIGNDTIIHSGSVIGSDGFGFAHTKTGEHVKIYQNGNVIIEDDVEIGANTTVDCAVFGSTVIKKGCKIDNLVQIGHNAIIGEYSLMVSQSGVAGSTTLGRNVVMGGQAAAAGHLEIAPFSTFAARSGITKDIKEGGKTYAGFPLMGHREWLKLQGRIAKLLR